MKWKKFILLGDSNTQFGYSPDGKWVSMLSHLLQRQCDVVNRGFSGYNSTHLRKMVPEIMEEFDVKDIAGVILWIGSNDSTHHSNEIQVISLLKAPFFLINCFFLFKPLNALFLSM